MITKSPKGGKKRFYFLLFKPSRLMSLLFGVKIRTPQVTFAKRKKNTVHTLGIGVFNRSTKNVGNGFWECLKAARYCSVCDEIR